MRGVTRIVLCAAAACALGGGAAAAAGHRTGETRAATNPAQRIPAGYATVCAVDLSRPLALRTSGPICGTDEGDDLWFAGEGVPVAFFGENGRDTVEGSHGGDSLAGGGGNDELHGGRGDDQLDGGDDSDVLFGGPGADRLVERRFGFDHLYGGQGDDLLFGGRANDRLYGGAGDDVLLGGTGNDHLFGGPGDDVLYGGPGRDVYDCGPGTDTLYRTVARTVPGSLGARDPFVRRAASCETIVDRDPSAEFPLVNRVGGDAGDVIKGWEGRDLLEGKGGGDFLDGRGGDDELEGDGTSNQGPDLMVGGAGDDRLAGRAGSDRLFGDGVDPGAGGGRDELVGGAGRDTLVGGPGDDLLVGAYDGDRVLAGEGDDVVTLLGGDASDPNGTVFVNCGPGLDTVVINPARRGRYARCEYFADQFHEADHGRLLRPSPVVIPGAAARAAGQRRGLGYRAGPAAPRSARPPAAGAAQLAPGGAAEPDGGAGPPSLDFDGDRVAFSSDAGNLHPSDSNGERTDPFVRDLSRGRTMLADAIRGGGPARIGGRFRRGPGGTLSSDGRFAVYSSRSPDLPGGAGHRIIRHDLATGAQELACRLGNGASESAVISGDGRFVAFESRATNLAGRDTNQHTDVFRCDLATGRAVRVSVHADDTVNGAGSSLEPAISGQGRFVAWTNDGSDPGVWWRDMDTGERRLVAREGSRPRLSADGRLVVYEAEESGRVRVFRRDVYDGTVVAVTPGAEGSATADSVSADGNLVAFSSPAANLVPGDANGQPDVFVRDVAAGVTTRVSVRGDGSELAGPSYGGALSGDGRMVAFASRAPGVTPDSGAGARARIYRRDLVTGTVDHASAGIDLLPRSLVAEPAAGSLARRYLRAITGTAEDNGYVARVELALARSIGRGRCQWLRPPSRVVTRSCAQVVWVPAALDGGFRWHLRLRGHRLPRGRWTLRSRATDDAGRVEPTRPGVNRVSLRLR